MIEKILFELMQPSKEDAEAIRIWRNDPIALAMSLTYTKEKTLEEFFPEFIRNYFSDALPSLFAVLEEKRIGAIRFDPGKAENQKKGVEISLIIAKEERNKGLGGAILLAIEPFLRRNGIETVIAKIKKGNLPSIKVFSRAGYSLKGEGEILIFEKEIAKNKKKNVFVIAEAGSNWRKESEEESLKCAFEMIEAAKDSGADAVKFQTFLAKDVYVANAGISDYLLKGGIQKDIQALFKELEMPREIIPILANHCKNLGIEFISSVFSIDDVAYVDPFVDRHKIASYEISHLRLLEKVAKTGKPLILSTGASDVSDIDWAVRIFHEARGGDLTLMQCTASYPASPPSLNLHVIPWLKRRYQCQVGLSDHSLAPFAAPLGAIALGASTIEKHFTLNKASSGPDHFFALEPKELKEMIQSIRMLEEMLGDSVKQVLEEEKELYFFAKRGIQALRDIQEGEILKEDVNMAILRPGKRSLGSHPKNLSYFEGKIAKKKIQNGDGIQFNDIERYTEGECDDKSAFN